MTSSLTDTTQSQPLSLRLLSNSLWNLSGYFAYTIVTLVSTPLYIHFLGIHRYGLLTILNSILIPLGLLNLGFGQATVKYVAESYGQGRKDDAGRYIGTTLLFNLGVGVLGAVVIVLLAHFLTTRVFKIEAADQSLAEVALVWVALGWLVTQIIATFTGVPTALQKYNIVSIGTTASASVSILVGLLVLLAGGDLLTLIQARFVWSVLAALLWGVVACKLLPGVSLWPKYHGSAFRRSFHFGIWQTLAGIGSILSGQTDRFVLGIYVSTAAVGLFNIAFLVYQVAFAVIAKLGEVLFPAISDLQGKGLQEQLIRLMLRSSWVLATLMVAVTGPLFVFSHDILRLYINVEVADGTSQVLRILALTAILGAPSIGVAQYLLGTGNTVWTALTTVVDGLIIFVFSIILVPRYGLQGAAVSALLAIVLSRPLIHFLIWRRHLRRFVRWQVAFAYLYGPVMAGMLGTLLLAITYDRANWKPGWIELVSGLAGGFFLLCIVIVLVDSFLPISQERRSVMLGVASQLRDMVRKN